MQHADMASIGLPVPFAVRVFGTLNAPGVFAIFVMTGLLLGSCRRSRPATSARCPSCGWASC